MGMKICQTVILILRTTVRTNDPLSFNKNLLSLIEKARKICKIFHKSHLENEKLQDFIKGEYRIKIKLLLDLSLNSVE